MLFSSMILLIFAMESHPIKEQSSMRNLTPFVWLSFGLWSQFYLHSILSKMSIFMETIISCFIGQYLWIIHILCYSCKKKIYSLLLLYKIWFISLYDFEINMGYLKILFLLRVKVIQDEFCPLSIVLLQVFLASYIFSPHDFGNINLL